MLKEQTREMEKRFGLREEVIDHILKEMEGDAQEGGSKGMKKLLDRGIWPGGIESEVVKDMETLMASQ